MSTEDQQKGDGAEGAEADGKTKTIASPILMRNLSPIASLAKNHGINFQPPSQGGLLKYAVNKAEGQDDQPAGEYAGGFKTNK